MDNIFKLILLLLISSNANATWTKLNTDGPVQAQYMRTDTYTQLNAKLAPISSYGSNLSTTAPNTLGSNYISPTTTNVSSPSIASNVKIPLANAAGVSVAATLTALVSKSAIAKAAMALLRLSPAISAVTTLAWLANAGIQYISGTDTFNKAPTTTTGGQSCASVGSVGSTVYTTVSSTKRYYTIRESGSDGNICASYGETSGSYCTSGFSPSPQGLYPRLCYKIIDSFPAFVPTTLADAETTLANAPITGASDTTSSINNELSELIKNNYIPEITGTPQLRGPTGETTINKPGGTETTTTPDGTITQRRLEYQTRFADDRAEIEQLLTETVTPVSGSPTTTTTSKPAEIDNVTANAENKTDTKTDCDKYPDSIGCSKYGNIPAIETIPQTNVSISLNPTSLGSGSCPSPQVLNLQGQPDITLSYQPYCNFATGINPIVVALAWLSAGFIVMGAIKE